MTSSSRPGLILLTWLGILLAGPSLQAITLDQETHDALIAKLVEVRSNLSLKDLSYVPSSLRIADLLSDRARLADMKSMSESGKPSDSAKQDRLRAITIISECEPALTLDQKVKVDLQKSQLLILVGEAKKSRELLIKTRQLAPRSSDEYFTATDMLADVYFSEGDFAKAYPLYLEISRSRKSNDYTTYRLAWCDLNLDREDRAISSIEKLLGKTNLDTGLRDESVRDLSGFYARAKFSPSHIEKIRKFSGDSNSVNANLKIYAEELKRLGKKKESAQVFVQYLKTADRDEKLTSMAELFENLVHVEQYKEANKILARIVSLKCTDDCSDVQVRIHRTLRGWAFEAGRKVSADLLQSFFLYGQMKPLDQNALLFGIKMSQDAQLHLESLKLLALLIKENQDPKVLETALRVQLASAEKAGQINLKEKAYRDYLDRGTDPGLKKEILSDLIESLIASKSYVEAEKFALKSYEQSLDKDYGNQLLVIYQKSAQTEKERLFSLRMAGGQTNNEYFKNYKRISLNSIKQRVDSQKADNSDLKMLKDLSRSQTAPSEKFRILSDAFLVAYKLEDFGSLKEISEELLKMTSQLNSSEKLLVYEKRILVADLELDFVKSIQFEKLMPGKNETQKVFRLALKSRLAGRPDVSAERQILEEPRFNQSQKVWVLENQITHGSHSLKALAKYSAGLKKDIHSRLALMAMAKSKKSEIQNYVLSQKNLKGSLVETLVLRQLNIENMKREVSRIISQSVKYQSLNLFGSTLESKISSIQRFEKQYIAGNKDSVGVMIGQGYWILLNQKLVEQLEVAMIRIKAPTPAVKAQIDAQLKNQVANLKVKITATETQILSQWTSIGIEKDFEQIFRVSHPLQKDAIVGEIESWKEVSAGVLQRKWTKLLESQAQGNESSLAQMYERVKRNPFQRDLALRLSQEEETRGNHMMSVFLTSRDQKARGGI